MFSSAGTYRRCSALLACRPGVPAARRPVGRRRPGLLGPGLRSAVRAPGDTAVHQADARNRAGSISDRPHSHASPRADRRLVPIIVILGLDCRRRRRSHRRSRQAAPRRRSAAPRAVPGVCTTSSRSTRRSRVPAIRARPDARCSRRTARSPPGPAELRGEIRTRGPQNVVDPLQLGDLFAEPLVLLGQVRRRWFRSLTGIGLADPVPKRAVMDTQLLGEPADRRFRVRLQIQPDRSGLQLVRVFLRCCHAGLLPGPIGPCSEPSKEAREPPSYVGVIRCPA